jgi:hypothetical protein
MFHFYQKKSRYARGAGRRKVDELTLPVHRLLTRHTLPLEREVADSAAGAHCLRKRLARRRLVVHVSAADVHVLTLPACLAHGVAGSGAVHRSRRVLHQRVAHPAVFAGSVADRVFELSPAVFSHTACAAGVEGGRVLAVLHPAAESTLTVPGPSEPYGLFELAHGNCLVNTASRLDCPAWCWRPTTRS